MLYTYSSVTLNGVGELDAVYSVEYPCRTSDIRRVMLIDKNNELHTWNEIKIGNGWYSRAYGWAAHGEMVAANSN